MNKKDISIKDFDLIIIGSGAAGLRSAISAHENGVKKIAIISKVIPTNSHTVAAKGGINASLGNVSKDDWRWHAFDTIKGSDYLADEEAVNILCQNAKKAILDLEKYGVVFSRDNHGKISQRAYGGQTLNYGQEGVAYRACYSKDKTGQTILYSLYNEAIKRNITFFSEFFVFDLLIANKKSFGALTLDIENGKIVLFKSQATIIATGGYSQIYKNSTSSSICTGDGTALILQNNLALQDMEFVQFHPTGISQKGFLISEAARGEGAYLLNSNNERFMKNYDPKMMELSSRDKIARAIAIEIKEGRGCGKNKNSIYLDLRHLNENILKNKLPGVVETAKKFAKIDVTKEPIEITPTAHYSMGGIPTNIDCQILDFEQNIIENIFAVGETACISVHGANRLGCNSLLDLIVFGEIAGKKSAQIIKTNQYKIVDNEINQEKIINQKLTEFSNIFSKKSSSNHSLEEIKEKLQQSNEEYLGVFRDKNLLNLGFENLQKLYVTYKNYSLKNKNLIFNDELISYLELKNLFLNSFASIYCAISRKESRGAHFRDDYPQKDDANWLCHSLIKINSENIEIDFRKRKL